MNKEELSLLNGHFIKETCKPDIFIITEKGNFIFSDPQFEGGTNKLVRTNTSAKEWMQGKLTHELGGRIIGSYAGDFIYEEQYGTNKTN